MKSLNEVCDLIKTGKTPPSTMEEYFEGDLDWFTPGDFNGVKYLCSSSRKISQKALDNKKASLFPKNSILLNCIGDIGKVGIIKEQASSNQQITCLKPKPILDVNYLYYWFIANKAVLENLSNNAVVPILNNRQLGTVKIPLPPLSTQKKIAAILDAADAHRQKTKQLLAKYDELAQSIFLEMFGDPVTNPKRWEIKLLKECIEKVNKIGKGFTNEKIFYIDISSIDNLKNEIIHHTEYKLEERPSRAQQILNKGDILFSTVRPNLKNIAINEVEGNIGSTGFFVIRPKTLLKREFIFELLKLKTVTDYFTGITSGANYPALKSSDISDFRIPIPNESLQIKFAGAIQRIDESKRILQGQFQNSENLFNSLLQKAFKMELVK